MLFWDDLRDVTQSQKNIKSEYESVVSNTERKQQIQNSKYSPRSYNQSGGNRINFKHLQSLSLAPLFG